MTITRREMCLLFPALAAAGIAEDQRADHDTLRSKIYNFSQFPVYSNHGDDYIPVFKGETRAGAIELHETSLAPGAVAHPPHHHAGEEIFMVCEGTLEVEIEGKRSQVGARSVAYIASNAEHALRNTSKEPTRYFVVLLGSPLPS